MISKLEVSQRPCLRSQCSTGADDGRCAVQALGRREWQWVSFPLHPKLQDKGRVQVPVIIVDLVVSLEYNLIRCNTRMHALNVSRIRQMSRCAAGRVIERDAVDVARIVSRVAM